MRNETVSHESAEGIEIGPIKPTACLTCKTECRPRRTTARYCSDACRVSAARRRIGAPVRVAGSRRGAFLSVTGHPPSAPAIQSAPSACVTLIPQQTRAPKQLDPRIVPDAKWPGMYRIRLPDGSLSVMVNLTRAKDALRNAQ